MGGRRIARLVLAAGIVGVVAVVGPGLGLFQGRLLPEGAPGPVYDLAGTWSAETEAGARRTIDEIRALRGWGFIAVSVRSEAAIPDAGEASRLADRALRDVDDPALPQGVIVLLLPATGDTGTVAVQVDGALASAGFDDGWRKVVVSLVASEAAQGASDEVLGTGLDVIAGAELTSGQAVQGPLVLLPVIVLGALLWGLAIGLVLFALREDHRRGWWLGGDRRPPWMR